MRLLKNQNPASQLIKLKNIEFLENQRIAGKAASNALILLENLVKEKTNLSTLQLSKLAEEFILDNKCEATFKNYKSFPESVCISVNQTLVHGIPNDYHLQEGDVVKFDLGATYKGAIADTAIACIFGEPKHKDHVKLVAACKEALDKGIAQAIVGNQIGAIGNAIYKSAKNNGFDVIVSYGGHGICMTDDGEGIPHAHPFVSNKSLPNEGVMIVPGLTIAIEPLLTLKGTETKVSNDGWGVMTESLNAHFEHTLHITENGTEVITQRHNENSI